MLQALELHDFAIVDSLRLELSPGLNVLTGETGAGKSILIDALALLAGGRADLNLIRAGRGSALIQGLFAEGAGLESAARRLQAGGRSSARLDGELVTVGELSERLGNLVAIHGQHASQVLSSPAEQRKLLDRLLDEEAQRALGRYRETYALHQQTERDLERLREATRERARWLDILQFQLSEIDNAKLEDGEKERLEAETDSLRHAERILQGAGSALENLSEGEVSALSLLAAGLRDLAMAGRYQPTLAALALELGEALSSAQAIGAEVASFLSDFEAEPGRLETLEKRLSLIESLERKYGEGIGAVLAYRAEAERELGGLQDAEENVSALEARRQLLLGALSADAGLLSQARERVAETLGKAVTRELRTLGMRNAAFSAEVRPSGLGAFGGDEILFLFSANLGEPSAPLASVASGGELSRVMLALNVVTGSEVPVLAFDEVDAGIGGKTARAVGGLLKQLARTHQVLVVTHLPQVAAFADAQFYVEKEEQGGRTVTRVRRLEPLERELELARMLSGSTSDAALANARELLAEASL